MMELFIETDQPREVRIVAQPVRNVGDVRDQRLVNADACSLKAEGIEAHRPATGLSPHWIAVH